MAKLRHFNRVVKEFRGVADFLLVYVQEAHATDGWSIKGNYDIRFHRSLQERLSAAQNLADTDPPCPIVVDNMQDDANRLYGVQNERLYIVLNGRVVYKGNFGPDGYNVEEMADWLQVYNTSVNGCVH